MTDRELLELAAKAIGIDHWFGKEGTVEWNPLEDDGDALRLAVKIKWTPSRVEFVKLSITDDAYAATRRAIVRAAAQIGKEMK
jgi:hypothetical protein